MKFLEGRKERGMTVVVRRFDKTLNTIGSRSNCLTEQLVTGPKNAIGSWSTRYDGTTGPPIQLAHGTIGHRAKNCNCLMERLARVAIGHRTAGQTAVPRGFQI